MTRYTSVASMVSAVTLPLFAVLFGASWLVVACAAPDEILVQKMVGGINHSILLAIPFFIFAGELMSDGRIARLLSRSENRFELRRTSKVRGGA